MRHAAPILAATAAGVVRAAIARLPAHAANGCFAPGILEPRACAEGRCSASARGGCTRFKASAAAANQRTFFGYDSEPVEEPLRTQAVIGIFYLCCAAVSGLSAPTTAGTTYCVVVGTGVTYVVVVCDGVTWVTDGAGVT